MDVTSRVTIRDVAEQAGVSVATVSKVINQRYGVSHATTGRVHEVIAELGYESSLVARSLRNHVTNVIGILVLDIEPFSAELLKGAARAIRGPGFELVVYSAGGMSSELVGWERRSLSRLSGTLIDGAVLVTPTVVGRGFGAPVVAVDPHTGGSGVPTIDSDNLRGAQTATEHLIGLGHRRIGFLAGRPDLESARLRELGYRQALRAAGIAVDPELLRVGAYEESASEQPARELLTMADRPTAIFAANDTVGDHDDGCRALARPRRTRRPVRHRVRQHPRERADAARADHDRPADPADGRAGDRAARRADAWRAARRAPTSRCPRRSWSASPAVRRLPRRETEGITVSLEPASSAVSWRDPAVETRRAGGHAAGADDHRGEGRPAVRRLGRRGQLRWWRRAAPARLRECADDWPGLIRNGISQLTRPFGTAPVDPELGARGVASSQREIVAAGRFGIPALVHEECLTGLAAWQATVSPPR